MAGALFFCHAIASEIRGTPSSATSEAATVAARDKVAPWLQAQFQAGGKNDVFVVMSLSADLSIASSLHERSERGRFVYDALRQEAASQTPLVNWLHSKGYEVTRFWIVNAILVKDADGALIDELTRRTDVARVVGNPTVNGLAGVMAPQGIGKAPATPSSPTGSRRKPSSRIRAGSANRATRSVEMTQKPSEARASDPARARPRSLGSKRRASRLLASSPIGGSSSRARSEVALDGSLRSPLTSRPNSTLAIECGISAVKADGVWSQSSSKGEGIVVGTMDTGVEWTHPALQGHYRGWDGVGADHAYSWHDAIAATTAPLDDNNHGTHVTGTMVGDDGGANQIGVAPGAKWVACRNMNHGNGTPATYLDCIQWGLAPYPLGGDPFLDGRPDLAPDITNNSWSCPPSEGCDSSTLRQAFENVRAAGQMTVGAAQNSGPSCSSIASPLGIHDAVLTIGAVDCGGVLATFSARGPITTDGSGRLKPDVAAPGVNVRSSVRGAQYAPLSGTSMATPHTSGVLALLWAVKPNLRHLIGISECYLEQSATGATLPTGVPQTCGGTTAATHPNNFWGWGKIDALASINLGPDGDSDGVADACDCAAADGGAFDAPPEIGGEGFTDATTLAWSSLSAVSGPGTTYDVVRGLVSQLRLDGGFTNAMCVADSQSTTTYIDLDLPAPDDAFYYLVRGQNGCGTGGWGSGVGGAPRAITICP